VPTFTEALGDRRFMTQYSVEKLGLILHKAGVVADADGNAVTVKMTSLDYVADPPAGMIVFSRAATRTDLGTYEVTISSVEAQAPGVYRVEWTYAFDTVPQVFVHLLEVGESSPVYDSLDEPMQGIVESAWLRFADLFDSPYGGPHLQVYFQTRFGRGRMAQLLGIAVNRLNTMAQPHQTYTLISPNGPFPYLQRRGPLDSYLEQPDAVGVNVARLDRSSYFQRWGEILREAEGDLKPKLEVFKIAHMGLGKPRVTVSGGIYGNWGPTRLPPSMAGRPKFYYRYF